MTMQIILSWAQYSICFWKILDLAVWGLKFDQQASLDIWKIVTSLHFINVKLIKMTLMLKFT
jgi:hypothetical protein